MYTTYTRIVYRISWCFLCMCVFFGARRNMLVVQPVVEFCDGSLLLSEDKCSTVG